MLAGFARPLRTLARRIALPQCCVFCGASGPEDGVCSECRIALPGRSSPRCPVCAERSVDAQVCGACLADPPRFARVCATGSYRFPVDAVLLALKYGRNLSVIEPLAALLVERVRHEPRPDLFIAMPLSPGRMRERGFNQAAELARVLAARLRVELSIDVCSRVRDTPPQAMLPWDQRRKNIRGAFACERDLSGARVVVLDDILTTGATLNELARVLLRAGAQEVVGWVVARTEKGP